MRDPYTRAEVHLDQAVEAEDYTEAARLRALMKEVGKPPIRRKKEVPSLTLVERCTSCDLFLCYRGAEDSGLSFTRDANRHVAVRQRQDFFDKYVRCATIPEAVECSVADRYWEACTSDGCAGECSRGRAARAGKLGHGDAWDPSGGCQLLPAGP